MRATISLLRRGHRAHLPSFCADRSWRLAFFSFDGTRPASQIPVSEACYACHLQHAAVDTTFVQFYPTLLGIATQKGTLAPGYRP